jgi:murein L,D-transpeptidase YafK
VSRGARGVLVVAGAAAVLGAAVLVERGREVTAARTLDSVLADVGPSRRAVLKRTAAEIGVAYPPPRLTLVGYKRESVLEVWAARGNGWTRYRSYAVLAASGGAGPKLREGDRQVPEGVYRLTHLNPASSYHLSIRVDYPNAFDRARGAEDGRPSLGGDIYIHGKAVSIGCLAIGDENIEELFTLVADTGLANARIVIAPGRSLDVPAGAPPWTGGLYRDIARELAVLPPG